MRLDELRQPISEESVCGPDLDLEFDPDFMNFLARAEGMLPGQFFTRDQDGERERPFERGSLNFQAEISVANGLLARTRDIRVLVVLAKFAALDRKLEDFVDIVDTIARLLELRWDEINPRAEGDDFSVRLAALQALDDVTHISLPLQFTPLIRHPRSGAIAFRHQMVADGTEPREGEEVLDAATIDRAFMDIALEQLIEQRDRISRLITAAEAIGAITVKRLDHRKAINLDLLHGLAARILAFLDGFVRRRSPDAALQPEEGDAAAPAASDAVQSAPEGPIADLDAVAASLAGVAHYFALSEPSSPALILVRQAEQLVGKNFIQVMQMLAPDYFDQAMIGIGKGQTFDFPIQRLSEQMAAEETAAAARKLDAVEVRDRAVALATLQQVEAYYVRNEPTSPVPLFCERARKLSSADFLTILKEVLPEHALKTQL